MKVLLGGIAVWTVVVAILSGLRGAFGIRFVIDKEECFSHKAEYGDTLRLSFVVIKAEGTWHFMEDGIDLVVKGPSGDQLHDFRDKTSEIFEFGIDQEGLYRFCFTNKSPYHQNIDFDIHIGHFLHDEHAKDEHLKPLLDNIAKLEEALYNVQFEQHWIEAQTERQAILNEGMSRRAIHKAIYESVCLVGASILQVYLLRRLFERKLALLVRIMLTTGVLLLLFLMYNTTYPVYHSYYTCIKEKNLYVKQIPEAFALSAMSTTLVKTPKCAFLVLTFVFAWNHN